MKKTISILGSTGSIGLSTLSIVDKKKNSLKVNFLTANKNFNLICSQIKKYKPKYFIINDKLVYQKIKNKFKNNKTKIYNDYKLNIKTKSDIVVSAIPGINGLRPTLQAIKLSKKILIANKEAIICGWNLIKKEGQLFKTKIIPIDSEHYSISKLLENEKKKEIKKIYITASGGPFLDFTISKLKKVKLKDTLKHPKWKMGKKISIDSATLMNKILEIAEAQKLFDLPDSKFDILIHPESLVHAIVHLKNGLVKFIYHETSMIIPISNAIFESNLDISTIYKQKNNFKLANNLTFKKVNSKNFPIIKLKKKINELPSSSIIFNAANEVLVDQFLKKKVSFLSIPKTILTILKDSNYKKYAILRPNNINQIINIDKWARETTLKKLFK
ncbi:1-deoxy-D-xylulose-5-phosphate reductoisomerase [Pelagibacteraceae bacterium]|nr:1-deoxy-D-xylulose-5-phosphate reductoisomerase [Pelagibacteraceae bacterium]